MTKQAYSGAFSRRIYSNYSPSSGTKAYSADSGKSGDPGTYNLSVTSGEPEMGEARFVQLTAESPLQTNSAVQQSVAAGTKYAAGHTFRAIARAKDGYRFVQWQTNIDGVGNTSQNPIDFKLTKDTWLIARFVKIQGTGQQTHTSNISWNGTMGRVAGNGLEYGNGSPANSGTITATQGATVTLNAEPKDGFRFVKWTGGPSNGKETSKTYTFQMNNNYNIRAEFVANDSNQGSGNGSGIGGGIGISTTTTIKKQESGVVSFVKKWWWAILIVAYIVYKEGKGGSK